MTAPLTPLVSSLRRRRAVPGKAFTPASVSGLVAAWDFSDTSKITASLGKVSQVDGAYGTSYALTQGTGSAQPTTGTRTQNSLNVLDFDGGDWLANTSFTVLSTWTAFIVALSDTTLTNYAEVISSGGGGGGDWEISFHGGAKWNWWATSDSASTATYSASTAYLLEALQTNGGTDTLDVNGSNVISAARTASMGTTLRLGDYWGGGGGRLNGWIAEALIYNSVLDSTNRTLVRSFLNSKWAVY